MPLHDAVGVKCKKRWQLLITRRRCIVFGLTCECCDLLIFFCDQLMLVETTNNVCLVQLRRKATLAWLCTVSRSRSPCPTALVTQSTTRRAGASLLSMNISTSSRRVSLHVSSILFSIASVLLY